VDRVAVDAIVEEVFYEMGLSAIAYIIEEPEGWYVLLVDYGLYCVEIHDLEAVVCNCPQGLAHDAFAVPGTVEGIAYLCPMVVDFDIDIACEAYGFASFLPFYEPVDALIFDYEFIEHCKQSLNVCDRGSEWPWDIAHNLWIGAHAVEAFGVF
jgi:hypothetical protein